MPLFLTCNSAAKIDAAPMAPPAAKSPSKLAGIAGYSDEPVLAHRLSTPESAIKFKS